MSLHVTCPYCNRPMAASPAMVGQRVACPSCRGEILLSPAALLATTGAGARTGSPATQPATSYTLGPSATGPPPTPPGMPQQPLALGGSAAPPVVVSPPGPGHLQLSPAPSAQAAPPQQPAPPALAKTAQFLANRPAAPAIAPAADGKLPTLALADAVEASSKTQGESAPTPLWLALLLVAGSTVISLLLFTGDFTGAGRLENNKVDARRKLTTFYGNDLSELRPFQVHLRQAHLAHSRGAFAAERDHYRKVLALLRAEGRTRFEGLTGTPTSDEELADLLAILLADG